MEIKKFVNGKVKLSHMEDGGLDEFLDGIFWEDIYPNDIDGVTYLVDFNTRKIYSIQDYYNYYLGLESIVNAIKENNHIYLYPVDKQTAKELFSDLENGY